jgi:hypothetical protein
VGQTEARAAGRRAAGQTNWWNRQSPARLPQTLYWEPAKVAENGRVVIEVPQTRAGPIRILADGHADGKLGSLDARFE